MVDRPCKLDADLKRLWRLLLPSTPYPACGEPEKSDAAAGQIVRNVTRVDQAVRSPTPNAAHD
jgi:hypothetical protein